MATQLMNFPEDIQWERLCVSEDMIDREVSGERDFPPVWSSSLAAFYFEPEAEDQPFEDRIITYLKISCTITNYSPPTKRELRQRLEEVGVRNWLEEIHETPWELEEYWTQFDPFDDIELKYFPTYGALLQVAIGPASSQVKQTEPDEYPYIMDFEPKKREVYETASESNEITSRSLSGLNVRKGLTTTESDEYVDIDRGSTTSGSLNIADEIGGAFSRGTQGEWGTRSMNQEEMANIRSTDSSRELRETSAYATQLTHMYHQFISYHLGTNRAAFMMLPRPHVKTSDFTFINGPIQLQGIQEVFLVINRPKNLKDFCLDAKLETAHLVEHPLSPESPNIRTEFHTHDNYASYPTTDEEIDRLDDHYNSGYEHPVIETTTYDAPSGWKIDLSNGSGSTYSAEKGYDVTTEYVEPANGVRFHAAEISVSESQIQVTSTVSWFFRGNVGVWNTNELQAGRFTINLAIHLVEDSPSETRTVERLYIVSKDLSCCRKSPVKPKTLAPSVVFELDVQEQPRPWSDLQLKSGVATADKALVANQLIKSVGEAMIRSLGSDDRYPYGTVGFHQTDFFANRIAQRLRSKRADDLPLSRVPRIHPGIKEKVMRSGGDIRREQLLSLSLKTLRLRYKLTQEEASYLRAAIIGIPVAPPSEGGAQESAE